MVKFFQVRIVYDTNWIMCISVIDTYHVCFSTSMGVPGKTVGTMFTPVPVEILCQEAERVGGENICINLTLILLAYFA